VTIALRVLLFGALTYLIILAALYAMQSRFIYPAPQDVPPLTPGYSEVELTTDDGLRLRAFHKEASPGSPTVVYFHGNGGTLAGASVSNGAIAEARVGVLLVEYRGYGGNAGEPSEEGFYRDADAALRWLEDKRIARSDTVVVGNSIGSGSATFAAAQLVQEGTPPLGLILIAPFTSLPDVASESLWWLPVHLLMQDTYPNRERLKELGQIPTLIQHGTADNVIGDSHGRALASASASAQFRSYEGSGHGLSFEQRSQEDRLEWILGQVGTGAEP
jgi:uncharacterized protein